MIQEIIEKPSELETEVSPEKIVEKSQKKRIRIVKKSKTSFGNKGMNEFNDPIYAGFEHLEENRESDMWGPWVERQKTPNKISHSLSVPKKLKVMEYEINKRKGYSLYPKPQIKQNADIPKNALPQIKEKHSQSLKQIRMASLELLPSKQVSQSTLSNPLSKSKGKKVFQSKQQLNIREAYLKKAKLITDFNTTARMSSVVFNYCTEQNTSGSLLEYHRKKRLLENGFKARDIKPNEKKLVPKNSTVRFFHLKQIY